MEKNVVLFDNSPEDGKDFIRGLEETTKEKWLSMNCRSDKGRNPLYNILRYFLYFCFPFFVFLNRKKYKNIIGWQAFYGFNFAFFCRLFRVKKTSFVIIKNFTYKPKKNFFKNIYEKYMDFVVNSEYIDVFICTSDTMVKYCSKRFPYAKDKFVSLPFGVNDFTKKIDSTTPPSKDFVLALGRSNRDWDFLINSFQNINEKLIIICDSLKRESNSKNISILNNVGANESFKYIYNSKCMIIPIDDGNIASGETVLLQSFSFSKPVIITKPSCLANDYVKNNYNGIIINKTKKDLEFALKSIQDNQEKYNEMCNNARKSYEEKYTIFEYGKNVGKLIK